MSKKSRKAGPHRAAAPAQRKMPGLSAKPPAEAPDGDAAERIARALERIVTHLAATTPASSATALIAKADAFIWHPDGRLAPVPRVSRVDIGLLKGIDRMRDILIENTERFANGLPANNALLWGARGMGKSSLVKAAHATINLERKASDRLKLIEIHREDIDSLPHLLRILRTAARRIILFCDDLSFDKDDTSYKSLKAALEGGIEGRPVNTIFYATSNRRHLMPRDLVDNERGTAINPGEAVEEKVSLSDRFGLWLGFHHCGQDEYLAMIDGYAAFHHLKIAADELRKRALTWSIGRGGRSGRVAWQFIQDLAGELGQKLD